MEKCKYGYLRETQEIADKEGTNKITGLCRTGLDTYLKVIFPKVNDWIHDECIPGSGRLFRPDYRSEKLKLIVEFDGMPHYTNPENVLSDIKKTKFYIRLGYKVVRIPLFIQLTNKVVEQLFCIKVKKKLFPEGWWSMSIYDQCTPAFFCPLGIKRIQRKKKLN